MSKPDPRCPLPTLAHTRLPTHTYTIDLYMNLPWRIWNGLGEFEIAAVNLSLPQRMLIHCGEFEFEVMNLDLLQWHWIYRGAHESAVQGFPQAIYTWGGDKCSWTKR